MDCQGKGQKSCGEYFQYSAETGTLPQNPEFDSKGLRMEILCPLSSPYSSNVPVLQYFIKSEPL